MSGKWKLGDFYKEIPTELLLTISSSLTYRLSICIVHNFTAHLQFVLLFVDAENHTKNNATHQNGNESQYCYYNIDPGREMRHRVGNHWMVLHWAIPVVIRPRDIHTALSIVPKYPHWHAVHTRNQILWAISCSAGLQFQYKKHPQFVRTAEVLQQWDIVGMETHIHTLEHITEALWMLHLHTLRKSENAKIIASMYIIYNM